MYGLERPSNAHFFAQDEKEFDELLQIMKPSMSILEIGSRFGQSLKRFCEVMPTRTRVVSVDLGFCIDSKMHSGPWLYKVAGDLAEKGHEVHLILDDSHDPKTVKKVEALGPFDFIFIDGDHSEQGVNLDWINYGHLGKIVAFHDYTIGCIKELWDRIPKKKQLIWNSPGGPGIAIIYNE